MRVLQVIQFFSPEMGGSAQVAYQTAKHLGRRGSQVSVLTTDFAMQRSQFPQGDFEVVSFPNWVAQWGFYISPGMSTWLREHIREFDILHLHTVRTFQNALAHHYCQQFGVPYVISAHGTLPVIVERQLPKKLYDLAVGRQLIGDAARCIAVSQVESGQYRAFGVPDQKIHVIYNGLDLQEFAELPAQGAFRARHPNRYSQMDRIVLYLGRIHKRKNIDILMLAYQRLQAKDANLKLAVVGPDDGEQAALENMAAGLDLKGVIFHGPLYGKERLEAMRDAAVVVLPAAHEIFGLVPFEALMCGTPVIVADDSGAGQLVAEAQAGYIVPNRDVDALATAIHNALTRQEEANGMVCSGRRYIIENLDWGIIVERLEAIYKHVVNNVVFPS